MDMLRESLLEIVLLGERKGDHELHIGHFERRVCGEPGD